MCAILDTNAAHEVFPKTNKNRTEAGREFFQWLNDKGKLVLGGKLCEELNGVPGFLEWARQMNLDGKGGMVRKIINCNDDRINEETEKLMNDGQLASNDPHIIALAKVSGARLLFSKDKDLRDDFKDSKIINKPRGRVYSSQTRDKRRFLNRHTCKRDN